MYFSSSEICCLFVVSADAKYWSDTSVKLNKLYSSLWGKDCNFTQYYLLVQLCPQKERQLGAFLKLATLLFLFLDSSPLPLANVKSIEAAVLLTLLRLGTPISRIMLLRFGWQTSQQR